MTFHNPARILEKLEELGQQEGGIPDFMVLYRQILELQIEAVSQFTPSLSQLDENIISQRLTQGIPLLSFNELAPDWTQVKSLLEKITHLGASSSPEIVRAAANLNSALADTATLKDIAEAWYQGNSLAPLTAKHNIEVELLVNVMSAVFKPFLAAYAGLLMPGVNQELWRRRFCPVCGGRPDFAYLDKDIGARYLICSRCDAEWLFQRLECPYCGSQDQNNLAYFTDDKGLYRLYICEKCRHYLKVIDLRQTGAEILPQLERLLTFQLDAQAQNEGYKPCAGIDSDSQTDEGE